MLILLILLTDLYPESLHPLEFLILKFIHLNVAIVSVTSKFIFFVSHLVNENLLKIYSFLFIYVPMLSLIVVLDIIVSFIK